MGKIRFILSIIAVLLLSSGHAYCSGSESVTDSLMTRLQEAIDNRDAFRQQKESRILELRKEISFADDDSRRFDVLDALVNEYNSYNTDSAFAICKRRELLARRNGNPVMIRNAMMSTANVLATTGMYKEAMDIMDTIRTSDIPPYMHPFRYHILRTLYGLMGDYAVRDDDRAKYSALTAQYLDSLMSVNPPGSVGYVMAAATRHNSMGEYEKAVEVVNSFIHDKETTIHEKAICDYTLSETYSLAGDTRMQKEYLIRSAIADMQSAVREYVSLRELAVLLYSEGEVEQAYNLLRISMEDAAKCNARLRVVELNNIFPLVNDMYVKVIRRQQSNLRWSLIIISLLSTILLGAVFYVLKQMRRTAAARKDVELANDKLRQLNQELKASNADLHEANRSIAENSRIKEEYIARYMDQCSLYIEKLDTYRKQLGKLIAAGKTQQLNNTLKSTAFLDEELKAFYDNFDNTFLSLFPSFVTDFNALLRPEEQIVPKKAGHLNTELRIFALIRLGIGDSVKIAQFLRYSVTTIYNYRTKTRNKAIGDRDKLEEEVMRIGLPVS